MTRLSSELNRLFATPDLAQAAPAEATVRVAVIDLSRPADASAVSALWHGVQADLGMPAPALAVNGTDGFQLWFSFATAVPAERAAAWLHALVRRYWPDVKARRLRCWPSSAGDNAQETIASVPRQQASGDWSAFVAADLVPVFADTPWLDVPPGDDGQADLLASIRSASLDTFDTAFDRLQSAAAQHTPYPTLPDVPPMPVSTHADGDSHADQALAFLQRVMNDEAVPMALRIEAAKAVLDARRGRP